MYINCFIFLIIIQNNVYENIHSFKCIHYRIQENLIFVTMIIFIDLKNPRS